MSGSVGLSGATDYFIIFACFLLCVLVYKWFRERNYPPGPVGLPLVGYGPFMGKQVHKALRDLSKKYGDVFSFYIGPKLHICVSDYQLMKEILTNPLTLYRPPHSFDFLMGKGGMGGLNGEAWQEQRRFAFYTMRNLGLGKGLWESMIQDSASDFVEEIRSWKGRPTVVEGPLTFFQASNNIALLIGRHFDKEKDARKLELVRQSTRTLMEYFSAVGVIISLPWLTKVVKLFRIGGYHKFFPLLRQFEDIFRVEVRERMKYPESLTKDDFIGCYFKEMEKKQQEGKPHYFSVDSLLGSLLMLFMAGNDSTIAGVGWLLLLMTAYPDVQDKIHKEIDSVIGRDGTVYYEVKNKLPYTMATIHEMTRYVAISAVFPPRYALESFTFNGYTIPQGSHIICNIWAIQHDPKNFTDPNDFKPERFLADDGVKILKPDGHAPFSVGKRNCPGEGVAIMSIFMYFVHILQKFKVTMPPGVKPDLEPTFGGALLAKPQKMCFVER